MVASMEIDLTPGGEQSWQHGAKTSALDFKSFSAAREVFAHRFFHRLRLGLAGTARAFPEASGGA